MPQNNKTIRNDRFSILSESVIMPIMACKQNITKQGLFRTLSKDFCLEDIREAIETYYSNDYIKEVFTLDNLTKERAEALGFHKWSENQPDLYLFPLWFVLFLPYGTYVVGIGGGTFKYTKKTDLDIRFGCVAFGVKLKQYQTT